MEGSVRGNFWLRVNELLFKSDVIFYFPIFLTLTFSFGFARRHVGLLSGFVISIYISNIYTPLYPGFIFIQLLVLSQDPNFPTVFRLVI